MTFKDSREAFEQAIAGDRLSKDKTSQRYAGHYMYMGTSDAGLDTFKHSITRQYLAPQGWTHIEPSATEQATIANTPKGI